MSDTATRSYTVTALAGPYIAGVKHGGANSTVQLTDAQAAYELLQGTVVLAGTQPPPVTPPSPVTSTDVLKLTRNGFTIDVTVAELRAFLGLPTTPPVSGTASSDLDLSNPLSPGVSTIL